MSIAPVFHRAGFPEVHDRHNRGNRDTLLSNAVGEQVTQAHRVELARAAERYGYDSILSITTNRNYEPFVATSFLAAHTERIKFIAAIRPGFTHPTWVAQQIETFQEMSNNRLYVNIVTGSHEAQLRALGETLDKERRLKRTDEFFDVLRLMFQGEPFDYKGDYYDIEQGGLISKLRVPPKLFIGGSSASSIELAGKQAEIHLSYSETPPQIAETIGRVREAAARHEREIEFGILISVIARETSKEAWAETDRILAGLDYEKVQEQRRITAQRNSVSEARVQSLSHGTDLRDPETLKIYPNIWAGANRTTLVGSYAEVAERIEEYVAAGVKHFLIGGNPTMNSIVEFGEGVMPRFQRELAGKAA